MHIMLILAYKLADSSQVKWISSKLIVFLVKNSLCFTVSLAKKKKKETAALDDYPLDLAKSDCCCSLILASKNFGEYFCTDKNCILSPLL